MPKPHRIPGLAHCIVFTLLLAPGAVLRASPPEPIATIVGEWSGEVTRGVSGEALPNPVSSARRYWAEGDVVRAEIIIGGEGSLRTVQVAIVPRGPRFVRIVTPEGGAPEYFVGSAAERGVAWTPLQPGRERFVERSTGSGASRRLETLVANGDAWRVADALAPATSSAFGGALDGSAPASATVEPLVLPAASELVLLDRLAEVMELNAAAKANGDRLARELAAAWRETEEARSKARTAETDAAKARAEMKSASEIGTVPELQMQVDSSRRNLKEARDWAAELEKNLEETTRRADASAARVKALEGELGTQKEIAAAALAQATSTEGQRQEMLARLAETEKKRQGAETALAEAGRARLAAEEARAKAETDLAAARSALERAATERTALDGRIAQLTGAVTDSAKVNSDLADARAAQERLTAELAQVRSALTTAEGSLAAAAQRETERSEEAARTTKALEDLKAQQAEVAKARDEAVARLGALALEIEQGRTGSAQLVAELGALKSKADERAAEAEKLRKQLTESSDTGTKAEEERAKLQAELAAARQELEAATARSASLAQAESERQTSEAARASAAAALASLQKEAEAMRTATAQLEKELSDLHVAADERTREAAQARARIGELETAATGSAARVAQLEQELAATRAQVEERAAAGASDARVVDLETRLADTFARSEARQAEIDRLLQRVAQLEGAAPGGTTPAAVAPAVATVPAPTAPQPAVAATPAPPQPSVSTPETPARSTAPTRPAGPDATARVTPVGPRAPGSDPAIIQSVQRLAISGYRGSGVESVAVIDGLPCRTGQLVDVVRGVRFQRIEGTEAVFSGPDGAEYRRPAR